MSLTRVKNITSDVTVDGTTKVSNRLQVGDASITQQYPTLGYVADFQASSGSQTFISIAEPGASTLGNTGVVIGEDTNNTYITQRGNKSINIATSDTNRMIIDGSGRVTKPYQPSFAAFQATANYTAGSGYGKMIADGTRWNEGNHYSTSNSRFTAPIAGVYHFTAHVNSYSIDADYLLAIVFYVNNSSYVMGNRFYSRGGSDLVASMSHTMKLDANDFVEVWWYSNDPSHGFSSGAVWNTFSGFLVS